VARKRRADDRGEQTGDQDGGEILKRLHRLLSSGLKDLEKAGAFSDEKMLPPFGNAFQLRGQAFTLDDFLREIERDYIRTALEHAGGQILRASRLLGVSYHHMRYRIRALDIKVAPRGSLQPEDVVEIVPPLLRWLLDHELRAAARYSRPVSLVMMAPGERQTNIATLLKDSVVHMRRSDQLFRVNGAVAMLMTSTKPEGTLSAIERIQHTDGARPDLRFGAAFFPADGEDAQTIVSAARKRLVVAKKGEPGASIVTG